jgi:hypothetical protein
MRSWKTLRFIGLVAAVAILSISARAAQTPFTKGKFVAIQQKSRDKVDMYLVNTPVTTAVPYFEISVEVGDTDYTAEYTPRHAGEELPEAWKVGEAVQCRVEKHRLYLQRFDGSEMPWIITKKIITKKTSIDQNKSHE